MLPAIDVIRENVAAALGEDVRDGDVTAALIDADAVAIGRVICREPAVLCGRAWFDETLRQVDDRLSARWIGDDGSTLRPNDEVCRVDGPARSLLTAERTGLNFLQLLSGVATRTRAFVDAVAGTNARILDTRKTLPGLRLAQKYAVRCGGGVNHRIGLFDAYLIKENHIAAAGSIESAIQEARAMNPDLPLEIEVENGDQLRAALAAGPDRIMLDNFSPAELRAAVEIADGRAELEASGGIDVESIREVADTGVDFISVGTLTKDVKAVDFSMRFES